MPCYAFSVELKELCPAKKDRLLSMEWAQVAEPQQQPVPEAQHGARRALLARAHLDERQLPGPPGATSSSATASSANTMVSVLHSCQHCARGCLMPVGGHVQCAAVEAAYQIRCELYW